MGVWFRTTWLRSVCMALQMSLGFFMSRMDCKRVWFSAVKLIKNSQAKHRGVMRWSLNGLIWKGLTSESAMHLFTRRKKQHRAELLKKRVTSRTWIALSQVLANKSRSLLPGASYYYDYRHGIVFVIIICQSEMHFDSRSGQFGHKTAWIMKKKEPTWGDN